MNGLDRDRNPGACHARVSPDGPLHRQVGLHHVGVRAPGHTGPQARHQGGERDLVRAGAGAQAWGSLHTQIGLDI